MVELYRKMEGRLLQMGEIRGFDVVIGELGFNENTAEFTVRLEPKKNSDQKAEFTRLAKQMGLPASWYGRKFNSMTTTFRIIGLRPTRAASVIVQPVSGQVRDVRVCKPEQIRLLLMKDK